MKQGRIWYVAVLMITGLVAPTIWAGDAVVVSLTAHGQHTPEAAFVEAVYRSAPKKAETVEVTLKDGKGEVALPAELWQLQASAPGYWSAVVTVETPSPEPVELVLWPALEIEAQISMPEDAEPPQKVHLSLNEVPVLPKGAAEQPESADVWCQIADSRLTGCSVPTGHWHLRFRAAEYIPRYYWNLALKGSEATDLGEVVLERGAFLFGKVETSDGTPCSSDAKVELRPVMNRNMPGQTELSEELENLTETILVNEWGYFEFNAIHPGEYQLTAVDSGFMPATLPRVPIEGLQHVELREPLVLQRALELVVLISPYEDPAGQAWEIVVFDANPLGQRNRAAEGHAFNGQWISPPLAAGPYLVNILDANGNRLGGEDVELSQSDQNLRIELSLVSVSGRVECGDEAIDAQLAFSTGPTKIKTESDEDGQFDVVLSQPGKWRVEVLSEEHDIDYRDLEVEIEPEPEELLIDVPDTTVRGEVVYANTGSPAPDAGIMLVNMSDQGFTPPYNDVADSEGRFKLRGIKPGTYKIEASYGALKSPLETVQVSEADATPLLQLVLRKRWRLEGRVVSGSNPVPAAMIWAVPYTAQGTYASTSAPNTRSMIDGSFTIGVSDDAVMVRLVTMAPGHTIQASTATQRQDTYQDDLVIDLAAEGGNLHLSRMAQRGVVFINGAPISIGFLTQWAAINGQPPVPGEDIMVPAMPAGEYIFCSLSDEEAVMVLAGVAMPRKEVCVDGFLSPGETLSLIAP